MPDDVINPYADEPLYVQLAGIMRRMIQNGKLQHLDPVPSESSLVQAYGVSRDTVRRAVALLRDEKGGLHRAAPGDVRRAAAGVAFRGGWRRSYGGGLLSMAVTAPMISASADRASAWAQYSQIT